MLIGVSWISGGEDRHTEPSPESVWKPPTIPLPPGLPCAQHTQVGAAEPHGLCGVGAEKCRVVG